MSVTIQDGGSVRQDPNDTRLYVFDWDDNLATAAAISTSTFTVTVLRPTGAVALTKDNESIRSDNRSTQLRLSGAVAGVLYQIANKIVTNESPAQTKERSFQLLGEEE